MTEKEKVEIQREAFMNGVRRTFGAMRHWPGMAAMQAECEREYPMPARPRVIVLGAYHFLVFDGRLETAYFADPETWRPCGTINSADSAFIIEVAKLFQNPFEPVED